MAKYANPAALLPSAEELADIIRQSRPSLVASSKTGLNEVVKSHVQDAFVDIAKSRFQIGRLVLGALFAHGPADTRSSALGDLLAFEKANAALSRSAQGKADLAADEARIKAYSDRIKTAREFAGNPGLEAKDPLGKVYEVKKTRQAVADHEERKATAEPELHARGPRLIDRLLENLSELKEGRRPARQRRLFSFPKTIGSILRRFSCTQTATR